MAELSWGPLSPSVPAAGCESWMCHRPQRSCWRQAGPEHGQKTSPTWPQPWGPRGLRALPSPCLVPRKVLISVFLSRTPLSPSPLPLLALRAHLTPWAPPGCQGWERGRLGHNPCFQEACEDGDTGGSGARTTAACPSPASADQGLAKFLLPNLSPKEKMTREALT